MNVSELTGAALDYYVAKAEGFIAHLGINGCYVVSDEPFSMESEYSPSSYWLHGGPIIEREFDVLPERHNGIWRLRFLGGWINGATILECCMRAYVASRFGDEVPDLNGGEK